MDVSHNLINKVGNLDFEVCSKLENLNLSFNQIHSLNGFKFTSIKFLSLRNNKISEIGELQYCYSLVHLDLANNLIGSMNQVKKLTSLTELQVLWLEGNPIMTIEFYRIQILKLFAGHDEDVS